VGRRGGGGVAGVAREGGVVDGAVYASPDIFTISLQGRGGHGAMPEVCVNPLSVSAEILQKLHNIPNEIDEKSVVTVCAVNGGNFTTIIPNEAELKGTARAFSDKTRKRLAELIEEKTAEICRKYGAEYKIDYTYLYPPTINDTAMSRAVFNAAREVLGNSAIWGGEPSMGGEDFAYYAERVPSCIFRLGSGKSQPLHNPKFNIDESCLAIGVKIFVNAALNFFGGI
jgi:amidohydrolase